MENNDKEKWIDDVFDSVKGSERAKPNSDLFGKILNNIEIPESKIIPISQLKIVAAAAVVLLVLNIAVLRDSAQISNSVTGELVTENVEEAVISNYNIYAE